MPRIHQNAERYAKEDFQKEIRRQQGEYNLMSQRSLAEAAGIPQPTLWAKLKDPDKLDVVDLRKIVAAICPDPFVLLALVGYDRKTIRNFIKKLEDKSA